MERNLLIVYFHRLKKKTGNTNIFWSEGGGKGYTLCTARRENQELRS